MKKQVLLIEDDDAMRASLAQTLELEGISVIVANGLAQARRTIRANFAGVVLSDIRMPQDDGFAVLGLAKTVDDELPVVFLTGEADVPMALRSLKEGAYDFLEKPCPSATLLDVINRALIYRDVVLQKRKLERQVQRNDPAAVNFPGMSDASKKVQTDLRRCAEMSSHVLIYGPEGSGRKLAAYTIHALTQSDAQFIGYNFLTSQSDLSDLHLPDGAVNLSVKSMHLAPSKDIDWLYRQAADHPDLRLMLSGNGDMTKLRAFIDAQEKMKFSEITLPALRARRKDLPVIFERLLRQLVRNLNMDMPDVAQGIYAQIMARDWSANIPELRDFAQSYLLGTGLKRGAEEHLTLSRQLDDFEELVLCETLRRTKGKATQAAEQLGLPRKTFYDRLARYNIKPKEFR